MRKLPFGILGGTFNPVHYGHLRSAEEVREILSLERIIFIPASIPPHKTEGLIPFHHRYRMVEIAISDNQFFAVSDIEARRGGKSYSVETLEQLKEKEGDRELYFIVGSDAFSQFRTWKRPHDILKVANIVVIERPGFSIDNIRKYIEVELGIPFQYNGDNEIKIATGKSIHLMKVTILDISSSEIRKKVQRGESIKYLVPLGVENYIMLNNLYRNQDS